jgi:hypothetical protein
MDRITWDSLGVTRPKTNGSTCFRCGCTIYRTFLPSGMFVQKHRARDMARCAALAKRKGNDYAAPVGDRRS